MRIGALVAAGLCLLALVWWSLQSESPEAGRMQPALAAPTSPASVVEALPGEHPAREALPPEPGAAQPAVGSAVVEVLVVGLADGLPQSGRRVDLHGWEVVGNDQVRFDLSAQTDAEGRCRFEHTGMLDLASAVVPATPTSARGVLSLYGVVVAPGQVSCHVVEVGAGARLIGRVVDEQGLIVSGARVLAWCSSSFDPRAPADREVVADAQGRFELEHLGPDFQVSAEAPGMACYRGLRGNLPEGARAEGDLQLLLLPERVVRGRVRDGSGAGLSATLHISAHDSSSSSDGTGVTGVRSFYPVKVRAETDGQGRFEFGPLPAHTWNVRVESAVYGYVDLQMPAHSEEWVIDMVGRLALRGLVLDPEGRPCPGARVGWIGSKMFWRRTTTDAQGRFEIRGLAEADRGTLWVAAAGCAPWLEGPLDVLLEEPRSTTFEVRLTPGLPLAGRVVDRNGAPVPAARIVLKGERSFERGYSTDAPDTWEHAVDRGEARSGLDGAFRFEDLYEGLFALRVHPPGERVVHQRLEARAGATDLEVVLDRAAVERIVLTGRVSDARTGEPLRRFTVMPMLHVGDGARGTGRAVNDAAGAFRVTLTEGGKVQLTVQAKGYSSWNGDVLDLLEGERDFVVRLYPLRTIAVRLLEVDGTACRAVRHVAFEDLEGRPISIPRGESWATAGVGASEAAAGIELPGGPLRVRFSLDDGRADAEFDLDLAREPGPLVELHLGHASAHDLSVGCMVYSAAQGVELSEIEAAIEATGRLESGAGFAPLEARLEVVASTAAGQALFRGALASMAEGGEWSWRLPGRGQSGSQITKAPQAGLLGFEMPGLCRSLTLEAAGHEPLQLELVPGRENAGLPRLIILRRK